MHEQKKAGTKKVVKKEAALKAKGREFYKTLLADSDYTGEDYEVFSAWLGTTQ